MRRSTKGVISFRIPRILLTVPRLPMTNGQDHQLLYRLQKENHEALWLVYQNTRQ